MDRVAQEGKMKEKENEITDLADCTNHAYHVLWLARRIQHLWIIVAIIVHERTGMEVGGESCGLRVAESASESARVLVGVCVLESVVLFFFLLLA